MVNPEQRPLCVGNGNVRPFQGLGRGILSGLLHDVHLHMVRYVNIAGAPVGEHYAGLVEVPLHRCIDLLRSVGGEHLHLEISAMAAFLPGIGILQRGRLGHYGYVRLFLAAPAPFQLLFVALLCGDLEISLVELDLAIEPVECVPLAHSPAYPVHERPDRIVALVAQLALQLHGGDTFFAVGHEGHDDVPCPDRKFGALHYRATVQGRPEIAVRALSLSLGLEPVLLRPAAFLADDPLTFPDPSQMRTAGGLVGELFHKVQ
ncbi:hypothetical protein BFP77_04510 [Maribacter sp. 4U21]|nr:hypothetical protein BFP77_04510 [Maribacter sp. 4U21]